MIIVPQTPITEASFSKWKAFKVDITDEDIPTDAWYYIIPLVESKESDFTSEDDYYPHMFSSDSGEFEDDDGNPVYSVFLFDDDLPALTTEEEVELLYNLLTKVEIYN